MVLFQFGETFNVLPCRFLCLQGCIEPVQDLQGTPLADYYCPFYDTFKFSHVAGPVIAEHQVEGFAREALAPTGARRNPPFRFGLPPGTAREDGTSVGTGRNPGNRRQTQAATRPAFWEPQASPRGVGGRVDRPGWPTSAYCTGDPSVTQCDRRVESPLFWPTSGPPRRTSGRLPSTSAPRRQARD